MKVQTVYERLRDDLIAGVFPAAERLSEHRIGARYVVSRTPVREAVARLEHEGLLWREGSSVVVPAPTVEQVLDLFDLRIRIEADLAACAARRHREGDLVVLQAAAARVRALDPEAGAAERFLANRAFHLALSAAAHNDILASVQRQLDLRVAALRATTLTSPGRWEQANDQHDELVAAVAAGDANRAAAAAEQHLKDARALWVDLVRAGTIVAASAG